MNVLLRPVVFFSRYGWKGIYSIFFPVYWTQKTWNNGGPDIISIRPCSKSYLRATYEDRIKFIQN